MKRKSGGGDWATVVWQLSVVAIWLSWKLVFFLLRLAALGTVALVPKAQSYGDAWGSAAIVGCCWTVVGLVVGAFTGSGVGVLIGLGSGAGVGAVMAFAVLQRTIPEAQAAAGAIQVGVRPGTFGIAEPHLIQRETRVRHVAVFGPTGSGKSTVMKNIVLQDAVAPQRPGILCIDIKDDFALSLLDYLPPERHTDVVIFDPSDTEYPPAFNPLAGIGSAERTLATAELLGAFKRLYEDSWGPRLEHVFRHILLTLVETPDATCLDIARLLADEPYRTWAVSHVTNFSVKQFWLHEYPAIIGKGGSLANVQSLLNKLSVFSYPEVRNVVGQTRLGLDISAAMAKGQIVLAHLPQGILGEDIAHFFGALLVGKVQLAAQRRVQLPPAERRPFYVFADEFQNYDTSAFDKLITEGRSMGVGLVVACQFREQLPSHLRLSVEKNCAYELLCRVREGRHVVEVLKLQEPTAPDADILVRPPPPPRGSAIGQRDAIRRQSRFFLSEPRAKVEAGIASRILFGKATTVVEEHGEITVAQGQNGKQAKDKKAGYGKYFE